jgi:hypothetical protein
MTAPLYAITATDDNGNDWYAVNEPVFGGWCAMTREDVIIRMRFDASGSGDRPTDLYDHYGYAVALMHCATVMDALPAFKWSVKRFAR